VRTTLAYEDKLAGCGHAVENNKNNKKKEKILERPHS
jgi:hypothetical protein